VAWIGRALKTQGEVESLAPLVDRLRPLYPKVPAEAVEACVRAEYDRLHRLKDRTFVLVLVEQASKIKLGELSRDSRAE